jgi:hypothetical protein
MIRNLVYKFNNLIYDIDNVAYIIAQRVSFENEPLRQRITDVTQKNNLDRVKRVLDLAYTEVNEFCYPYTKIPDRIGCAPVPAGCADPHKRYWLAHNPALVGTTDRDCDVSFSEDFSRCIDENGISDAIEYIISLHLPPTTSLTTVDYVREHINEYFIWRVMMDWLPLNAPEIAKDYKDKVEEIETEIKSALTARMRFTTIKPSTF